MSGVDVDGVAVAAGPIVDGFDVQGVIPRLEKPAVLVRTDRVSGRVNVEDFDRVAVGGKDVEGEEPYGSAFACVERL